MCDDCFSRRRFLAAIPAVAAVAALPACKADSGPEDVRWGKEACAYCGMLVDDPRYAAQIRGGDKRKVWKFDDLGDGVLWLASQPFATDPATEFWVGDAETGKWIDARKAWFQPGHTTPMAHGFGAVADRRDGAISFDDMQGAVLARGSTSRCETPTVGS